jgi:hypothetical protein
LRPDYEDAVIRYCTACNWRLRDTDCTVYDNDGRPYCSTACLDAVARRHSRREIGHAQGDWKPVSGYWSAHGANRGFQRREHK